MASRIDFHLGAQLELTQATVYYESREPGLGERFLTEVRRILALIAEHPEIGPPIWETRRRFLLDRFPYAVVYRVLEDDSIRVLAVMHLRKRPGYWQGRE